VRCLEVVILKRTESTKRARKARMKYTSWLERLSPRGMAKEMPNRTRAKGRPTRARAKGVDEEEEGRERVMSVKMHLPSRILMLGPRMTGACCRVQVGWAMRARTRGVGEKGARRVMSADAPVGEDPAVPAPDNDESSPKEKKRAASELIEGTCKKQRDARSAADRLQDL
jgi:hypothetical protein